MKKTLKPLNIIKPVLSDNSDSLNVVNPIPIIVGIGASAGGLEALEGFFSHMPAPSHLAFVVIQHDPTQKGILAELLQRITLMTVKEASHNMKVEANCVYVIPPNKDMSILHGSLFLFEPLAGPGFRLPIDFFFRSLASDQQERAIGVILSGMGSDGTIGFRAIKKNAGLTLIQSPELAKFDSMPRSAINAELVEIEAPAEELPERLLAFLNNSPCIDTRNATPKLEFKSLGALEQIVILLRERTGSDFALYKKNTIYRRIERRMNLHQLKTMALYAHYLRENPQEQDLLFKELLIGVTNFFRDKKVWEQLSLISIPALLANYPEGKELRAWVTACSTGEEAYSLAMTVMDVLETVKPKGRFQLQIFATDLDEDAINVARQGHYPSSIKSDISPQQLNRYFIKDKNGYKIKKQIRDMVIFAPQNIIMDPPFTKLDIITCRNLLIYLGPELQNKLIPLFHYALNSQGILLLGNTETIGHSTRLFSALNDNARIFTCIDSPEQQMEVDFPTRIFPIISLVENEPEKTCDMATNITNLQSQADQILLRNYSPAAVLVNSVGDIIYINGRTGKYLEPAAGKANWNIYVMVREELQYQLTLAVKKAKTQTDPVIIKNLTIDEHTIDLTVHAITKPAAMLGLLMVVFTEVAIPINVALIEGGAEGGISQSELQHARDEIQAMREQMQASQEELRSANEELQSTNEELQTVNAELQFKIDDLSLVNNDMNNLFNSTEIATIFLDVGLNVRRFTHYATHLFKLIPSDVGRSLSDIVTELDYISLQKDAMSVLDTLLFVEKEITAKHERWFKVRIMPYRTQENVMDGVVITFTDISEAKLLESELRTMKPAI
ncbi:MAG: chemotaxis methyl-accepting protein methylase [Oleispira sp.]|jgi:chemotaxis methyl-accepting protein methylase